MKQNISVKVRWTPAKIVLIYLLLGFLWILLSDKILSELVRDEETFNLLQTYKGWFYVLMTGGMLYALIRSGVKRTREIEAARIASGKRYDELVENANDCIFTLDSSGAFTAVNHAVEKTTGYSREEILKMNFADLLAPENRDYLSRLRDPQTTRNPVSVTEVKIVGKDGNVFVLEISSRSPSLKDNRTGLENIARDVTHRHLMRDAEEALRKSEEQLMQAQKLESVGRLAGGIAHDFNNMLTVINGYSDLILGRMSETDPLRHHLLEIKKAGERSATLTQQLLAFSRKQILKPEILNINQTVFEIGSLLKRLIGEDIVLCQNLDPALKSVKVDAGQLSQVIVNLVVNAYDAMPKGGTLTIETKNVDLDEPFVKRTSDNKFGQFVMLSVSDTGIGMHEETKRRIFEPFFTTKEVGKGTGLGLATVYGFIKQSDGYITVDSEPDAGASFRIFLPCAKAFAEKPKEEASKEPSKNGAETILLVEDEEIVRNFGREILEACGYRVIEAASGAEALEICEKNNLDIDLLLTDVVMPEMSGRELWEIMTKTRPQIKVLFTSGYTDDKVVRSGITGDASNFLQKPFSINSLEQKVREVLDAENVSNNDD
jgi:two-component system cell cycle sensor histidine kinase/response regulator CckA